MHNNLVGIFYALSFNKNNKLIEEYFKYFIYIRVM